MNESIWLSNEAGQTGINSYMPINYIILKNKQQYPKDQYRTGFTAVITSIRTMTRVWCHGYISGNVCKVHLLFPSLARYFLLARFQIFRITNTWRKKKRFLRVARVICDKTINANSRSL